MGLENHRGRCGGLINVHVNHVNVHEFVATRYSPTYKNKPDDALHRRVFVLMATLGGFATLQEFRKDPSVFSRYFCK